MNLHDIKRPIKFRRDIIVGDHVEIRSHVYLPEMVGRTGTVTRELEGRLLNVAIDNDLDGLRYRFYRRELKPL